MTVRQAVAGVLWYLREVSGEADYDRYAASAERLRPGAPVLSRREFERHRMQAREAAAPHRCC